jgi:hypothetical protein
MHHIGFWGGAYAPAMTMLPQLREDRVGRGSNHKSFVAKAIPGVHFIDVNENPSHQHSLNDLFVYVTPAFTASLIQVVMASASSLVRAPTPPRNLVANRVSSSRVKLTWSVPASGLAVDHHVISARSYKQNFYGNASLFRGL